MKKLIIFLSLFFSLISQAAQQATVIVDLANVHSQPQPTASVVGTVGKNTVMAVSNSPTNGFYKARTPTGQVGWISGNDVLAKGAVAQPNSSETAPVETKKNPGEKKTVTIKKKKEPFVFKGDHSRILISGGIQNLSNGGFPSIIPTTNSNMGYGATLEFQFKLNPTLHWALRADYFTKASSQTVSDTTKQTLTFTSVPMMAGLVFSPVTNNDFRIGLGGYAGLAMMTKMVVAQSDSTQTITVKYDSSDFCAYGNLQFVYTLSSAIGVLGEAGYRIHTSTYPASTSITGLDAFTANYSGILARLGLEIRL